MARSELDDHAGLAGRTARLVCGLALLLVSVAGPGCGGGDDQKPAETLYGMDGRPDPKKGKPVSEWAAKLGRGEVQDRVHAAQVLGRIGPPARAAAGALHQAVRSGEERLAVRAAVTLVRLGEVTDDVLAALETGLKSQRLELRALSAETLGGLGERAAGAVPSLVALLGEHSQEVRQKAMDALAKLGSGAYAALGGALTGGEPRAAEAAGEVLARAGDDVVDTLAELIRRGDEARARVGPLLARHGEKAVPALLAAARSHDSAVRRWAVEMLRDLGPKAAQAAAGLVALLKDTDVHVRSEAQKALTKIGRPAVDPLIAALGDADSYVRALATECLGQMRAAESALEGALGSGTVSVRLHAAQALLRIEADAKAAVAVLAAGLTGAEQELRALAARTLAEVEVKLLTPHVPALIKALGDSYKDVRRSAARAVRRIGPPASDAIPALVKLFKDADEEVAAAAVRAVGAMGKAAAKAKAELEKLKDHWSVRVRGAAEEALEKIGD